MHDIGSSRPGGWGAGYNEFEQGFSSEMAGEFGQELENEIANEFGNEFEQGEASFGNEFENEFENEISGEMQEMELAAELLAVNNEQEMEQFLGGLIKSVGRAATGFAKSSAGKALGGILRSAAKSALPIVGSALGNLVVPGAGGAIGGKLASMAGNALGLELEGLSNEDREFEVARRVVRIGRHAANHLATTPIPPQVPPARAAHVAFLRAAKQVAPGLLPAMKQLSRNGGAAPPHGGNGGGNGSAMGMQHPGTSIFGPASGGSHLPVPMGQSHPGGAVATVGCPSCGTQVQAPHTGHFPHGGVWRRSRNGRAIILYLGPQQRPAY
jgi:hypothetical protein